MLFAKEESRARAIICFQQSFCPFIWLVLEDQFHVYKLPTVIYILSSLHLLCKYKSHWLHLYSQVSIRVTSLKRNKNLTVTYTTQQIIFDKKCR